MDKKLLLRFQSKNAVFKCIRRSVDGALVAKSMQSDCHLSLMNKATPVLMRRD